MTTKNISENNDNGNDNCYDIDGDKSNDDIGYKHEACSSNTQPLQSTSSSVTSRENLHRQQIDG